MDTFEYQDKLFAILSNDTELLNIFNNPSDIDQLNNVFRREACMPEEVTVEKIPFVTFVFIDTLPTDNYMINNGVLEFNAYVSSRYAAMLIKRRIDALIKKNIEQFQVTYEGQVSSGVQGVICYRWRYKKLVSS
ncbi:hypothetical protein [Sporomusa aerivorans]|uniref:hypothetical protein n=1 Tax=Sporomusa aerivorans TaxID=204936 RepID=UPI00352B3233